MFKWLFGNKGDSGASSEVSGTKDLISISRRVDVAPARAFEIFVDEFARWWPRDYTWARDKLKEIKIDARMNGRCVEIDNDGNQAVWGQVLAVDRPNHIVIAWQIRPDRTIEPSEAQASRLDIRFSEPEPGKTDVLVVHRDFFRHGEGWEKYRADMATKQGWPMIMEAFAGAVSG